MSFDGIFTHSMTAELANLLAGGRVSKINQPYPNEVIMNIRSNRKNYPLLLSANPTYARVQITRIPFINPNVPTNFTMTLRKYLSGSVLEKVEQLENDRVVHFHFTTRNEIGDLQDIVLIIEIMARHSNVILVDGKEHRIIDAIRRVGADQNRYRTILPGSQYINPPKQNSINPFQFTDFKKLQELITKYPNQEVLAGELQHLLQGLGKDTAIELAISLHQGNDCKKQLKTFLSHYQHPQPTLIDDGKNVQFAVYPFKKEVQNKEFSTLSELLDNYYKGKVQRDRVREKGNRLIHIAKNELKKNRKKIKKLEKTLKKSEHADDYRIKGEVLTTYLNKVKNGMNEISLPNFYNNEKPLKISLSYNRTPSENAQWYFKQYQKRKNAVKYVQEQLSNTHNEINYFENIQAQIELAEPSDLDDINTELQNEGYLKRKQKNNKRRKNQKASAPERFMSDDGDLILVGKNNLQNDKLTLKSADKRNVWLHVQNIHGSHVIIRSLHPSNETITQAAELAAYFSKARESANVPVDYVQVRRVKKPNGAKPGFVIYEGQSTCFVTPTVEEVQHLRENLNRKA